MRRGRYEVFVSVILNIVWDTVQMVLPDFQTTVVSIRQDGIGSRPFPPLAHSTHRQPARHAPYLGQIFPVCRQRCQGEEWISVQKTRLQQWLRGQKAAKIAAAHRPLAPVVHIPLHLPRCPKPALS